MDHRAAAIGDTGTRKGLDPAACSRDVVSAAVERSELQADVRAAIDTLSREEHRVVVMRGIEQLSNNKVAEILGVQPSTATARYQKALERLRRKLPDSVFADLAEHLGD